MKIEQILEERKWRQKTLVSLASTRTRGDINEQAQLQGLITNHAKQRKTHHCMIGQDSNAQEGVDSVNDEGKF